MKRLSRLPPTRKLPLAVVVAILLLGFGLRTTDVGAGPLQGDESWLAFLAYNFGHNGQRAELGVTSSAGINQPPFFHDVMAIPFAFDPDPRIARLFMATLQLVGMAILYFMLRRYWHTRVALIGLTLYALFPRAVWAGRILWNPYLAIPFIIAFLATGLLTTEGKRWARWLHFPMLACMIGAHPILAMTGVIWPVFVARDWYLRKTRAQRVQLIRDYAVGIALAGLVLLPWGIGLLHQRLNTPGQGAAVMRNPSQPSTILQFTIDAASNLDMGAFLVPDAGLIPIAPGVLNASLIIGWLTLLGSLYLAGRALFQMIVRRQVARRYPDLVVSLVFLTPPIALLFSPTRTYDQYFVALVPCSAAILAILLSGRQVASVSHPIRPVSAFQLIRIIALVLIGAVDMAYVGQAVREIDGLHDFSGASMPPIQAMVHLRDATVRPGVETIYLVDSSPRAFEQAMVWLTLATKGDSRVVWGDNFALPVPKQGATYVGYADSPLIPELYQDRPARIISNNLYRVVDVPANSGFTPTCRPNGAVRLSNGATLLGYYVPVGSSPTPLPGNDWTIYILWTGISNQPHTTFQLFSHLVDAQGTKFAQHDLATLDTDLWRADDLLVSKVTLSPNAQTPVTQPLSIRVGMYTLPTATNPQFGSVSAIDNSGSPVGGWVTIPICEAL